MFVEMESIDENLHKFHRIYMWYELGGEGRRGVSDSQIVIASDDLSLSFFYFLV